MSTVVGTCPHDCPDSCGWTVTVEDQAAGPVAVQLRGNPAHPYSAGELCPKVNHYLDRVYSPDRVLHPLRRIGAKGEGRFERITWDEALTEIAGKADAIVVIGSYYGAKRVRCTAEPAPDSAAAATPEMIARRLETARR